mmetsp:Transcript_119011/g.237261  ORF Transcript_119011/g.237261 Transcript_119011/m.237261 type:complete len:100 (-) Transcript_119011:109-408(-)
MALGLSVQSVAIQKRATRSNVRTGAAIAIEGALVTRRCGILRCLVRNVPVQGLDLQEIAARVAIVWVALVVAEGLCANLRIHGAVEDGVQDVVPAWWTN